MGTNTRHLSPALSVGAIRPPTQPRGVTDRLNHVHFSRQTFLRKRSISAPSLGVTLGADKTPDAYERVAFVTEMGGNKLKNVKDLTIPFEDYAHVSADDTLAAAIAALVKRMVGPMGDVVRPRDRGVLVQAADGRVIGKLSIWDLLAGLTPSFEPPVDPFGTVDDRLLWSQWLRPDIASRARSMTVGQLLSKSPRYETIEETAPLDLAVHRLIRGRHLSLLVTRGDQIVGILRLSDVLTAVNGIINAATAEAVPA